jgi:methionine biosynthesis protein MetW
MSLNLSLENISNENKIIASLIEKGASVLDMGCGDGDLLLYLSLYKNCKVQGIEIDEQAIYKCVGRGLSVLHGDIDSSLDDYPDASFDIVVLNQSFQQVKNPDRVLQQSLRIGRKVIVSFPNFAYISARCQMFFRGRTPVTPSLPYKWYNTPNLHFLSISDFADYCRNRGINVLQTAYTGNNRKIGLFPNLLAMAGIFVLSKKN